jgi:hypothetical protein
MAHFGKGRLFVARNAYWDGYGTFYFTREVNWYLLHDEEIRNLCDEKEWKGGNMLAVQGKHFCVML